MTFYVLNNAGDVRYPLDGQVRDPDEYSRRIRDFFQSNFHFHYDGSRNHVICYFKGRVNDGSGGQLMRNQFYGVYYGDGTERDLLTTFKNEVESAFDSHGWRTAESDRNVDAIYTNLTTAKPTELVINEELLKRMIEGRDQSDKPIQLGAPDHTASLRVCKRLIEQFDDIRLTICSSGVESDHPPTDVVVVPGDTDEPGAATRDTRADLEEEDVNRRIDKANEALGAFLRGDEQRAPALASAFDGGLADPTLPTIEEFDIRVDTPDRKAERVAEHAAIWGRLGVVVGVFLIVGIVAYYGVFDDVVGLLRSTTRFSLWFVPGVEYGVTVRSWPVFGACAAVILLFGLGFDRLGSAWTTLRTRLDRSSSAASTASLDGDAEEMAKQLLRDIRDIRKHTAIEAVGGFDSAVRDVFDTESSLRVYDYSSYRQDLRNAGLSRFLIGVGAVAALFLVLLAVGFLTGTFWNRTLQLLVLVSLAVVAVRSKPLVASGVAALIGLLSSASRPDRSQTIASLVVLLGAVTVAQLGTAVWRSGEGLMYNLVVALVAEGPGRFVSNSVGVEILVFTAVGFLFVTLGFAASRTDDAFGPAVMLLAMPIGILSLWYADVFTSWWAWTAGLVVGLAVGTVAVRGVDELNVAPERITSGLGVLGCALLAVVFVESQVVYQSPLVYSAGNLTVTDPSFGGYASRLSVLPVAQSGISLVLTGLTGYVLYATVVRTPDHTEVLVIGPDGSDPPSHVASLFTHFLENPGLAGKPDSNDTLERVQKGRDLSDDETTANTVSGAKPVKFTADGVTVWAPVTDKDVLGQNVFRKLDVVEERKGPNHLPESGTSQSGSHLSVELATALDAADVLVLLFPADGAETSTATDYPEHPDDTLPESRRYLRRYRTLLEEYLDDEQRVLGVVTGAGARLHTEDANDSRDIHERATDWAFEGASDELRDAILDRLDNSAEGTLLSIVETGERTGIGMEADLFYR